MAKYDKNDKFLDFLLQELRQQLGPHLRQVILFGSRARGDSSPDSDYDCLLVMDQLPPTTEAVIGDITGKFLYQYDVLLSLFPVLEKQYQQKIYDPFLMNIRKEGVVL
jgi:predicted nucleotidyltransferase